MRLLHIGLCVSQGENGFQKAFKDILGKENYCELSTGESEVNTKAINLFNAFSPDIVFFQIQAPNIITNQTFDYMKSHGAKVINWTGDKRDGVPQWMIESAPFVSVTSFSNMEDVREMRRKGYESEFLEIGYDPKIYSPDGNKSVGVPDVVFMANNYGDGHFPLSGYRIQLVKYLQNQLGDNFGVYGHGWQKCRGNINHSQIDEANIYRSSKIAINVSHYNCERYSSDRLLRILGTGVMCLSHKYPAIGMDYDNGKDLVCFESFDECYHKIKYYLNQEEERKDIAMNGNKKVLNRNTFNHQVENILKL